MSAASAVGLPALITRAADRFALTDQATPVSSALGLWLLLALVAPAAQGEEREQLQDALGCPVHDAADYADQLLGTPATAITLAAAAWDTPRTRSLPAYASWAEGLPAVVERGDVPDQAAADRWARRHTAGIIDAFPLKLDPTVVLVLANALATRVTWSHPFRLQPAWWLGGPWAEHVGTVLASVPEHDMGMAHTSAGLLAWHAADADGLRVLSVLGAPDASPEQVLRAAGEVAAGTARPVSLFDLPLGVGPYGTLSERTRDPGVPDQQLSALLPAWTASATIDLRHRTTTVPGVDAALATLLRLSAGEKPDAAQTTKARFTREGFEAASVTAMATRVSYRPGPPGRHLKLRFARPYAALAVAVGTPPWNGVPVVSAWVTEPSRIPPELL